MELKCSGVMTANPSCCLPEDSVVEAAKAMRDNDVGPIPIVDGQESRKLVGMVTDRDIAVRVVAEGRDPSATKVKDVMTTELVTCGPDDDLQDALEAMKESQVRRIPVVNDQGFIVGIIAQADIAVRLEAPAETAEVVEKISE